MRGADDQIGGQDGVNRSSGAGRREDTREL